MSYQKIGQSIFNSVERYIAVNGETTTAAEESLGKTFLAPEAAMLRLASKA
jgi:hypothetical protein